jgi:hypothetical protein
MIYEDRERELKIEFDSLRLLLLGLDSGSDGEKLETK